MWDEGYDGSYEPECDIASPNYDETYCADNGYDLTEYYTVSVYAGLSTIYSENTLCGQLGILGDGPINCDGGISSLNLLMMNDLNIILLSI